MKWSNQSYLKKQLREKRWEYRKREWRKRQNEYRSNNKTPNLDSVKRYMDRLQKHRQRRMDSNYVPSKGGPLKCQKHPDPAYHEAVRKLYRSTSKIYGDKKS